MRGKIDNQVTALEYGDFFGRPGFTLRGAHTATELPDGGIDLKQAVADLEGTLIEQALSRTGGNRNAAALLLGLNRTTLVEKLRRLRAPSD